MRFSGVPADPLGFWQQLHPRPIHGFFLGSYAATARDSIVYLSAGEPARVLSASASGASKLLEQIKKSLSSKSSAPRFVGFLGFEAGRAFDLGIRRLPEKPNPLKTPAALFGDYPAVAKIDFSRRETAVFCRDVKERKRIERKVMGLLKGKGVPPSAPGFASRYRRNTFAFQHLGLKDFSRMVFSAKDAISRGDIYQANLSFRFRAQFKDSAINLYRTLCENNPSPYACLLKNGADWLVSCSPELLLKVEKGAVVTRPIAGTRPRGKNRRVDARRRGQLLLSPKERAEHVMLVDLERNDLGRVCRPGTVKVTESCAVETYSHVMHIVSQVEGKLRPRKTSIDALKAVFPGGTITGCPKIKSIEVIQRLEKIARGPFYGSAGFFSDNGDATFNILIRTALIQGARVFIQAGAGIVADSHPVREYREVLAKARALLAAVGGSR